MFDQILIPLDGSGLAEAAIPPAIWLGERFHSALMLIHVIERNAPQEVHGERHLTSEKDACIYLDQVAARIPESIRRETHVHSEEIRNVASSIADHVRELGQDLVIMCEHGKGGVKQWMVGSIAQQVIGFGRAPVLLIKPDQSHGQNFNGFRRVMVALDEKPDHECGLRVAGEFALRSGASLYLISVVNKLDTLKGKASATGRLLPITTAAMLDIEEESAGIRLESIAKPVRENGVEVVNIVKRGEPSVVISQTAQEIGADLIVLGTHGKSGMEAFWAGSVAPKIPALTNKPLLLVPTCQ